MNRFLVLFSVAALLPGTSYSQEKLTVVPADSSVFSGLDLQAVGDLFTQSQTLEDFERALNDTTKGVNNLDLDGDGRVDFIRVVDEVAEDVHLIILQVPIDSVEYQDVATIEIEKKGDDSFDMQLHGNALVYGENYYVSPVQEDIHVWPVIRWIYAPAYVPYRSPFYFGFYPSWWHPFHPLAVHAYRAHINRWRYRSTFTVIHTSRVRNIHRVTYMPRNSTAVERRRAAVVRTKVKHERIHEGRKTTKGKNTTRKKGRHR